MIALRHLAPALLTLALSSLAHGQNSTIAPASPPTSAPKPAPLVEPNVLDGLESLQLAPNPADIFAGPPPLTTSRRAARNAGSGSPVPEPVPFINQVPPALSVIENAIRTNSDAPLPSAPGDGEPPTPPDFGQGFDTPSFPSSSLERRSFGNVAEPRFLTPRRGFAIGGNRVRYGADISGGVAYNNNVFGTASNTQGDIVMTLQPTLYVETGKKGSIRFLWAPSVLKYAKYKQLDAVNQTFLFSSRYRLTKLRLGLDASYVSQSGLFLNSQGQSRQSTLFARIFAAYPLSRKTELQLTADNSVIQAEPGGTQFAGSLSAAVDYRYSRKTTVGAGVTVGYYNAPAGSTTYQTFLLRLLYNPTSKLTFRAEGGLQFRQATSANIGSSASSTAVLSALLSYQLTPKTSASLRFFRNTEVDSFNSSNVMTLTGLEASVAWQITRRAALSASVLSGNVEQSTLGGVEDGTYAFNQASVSLSYVLLNDINVRVFNNVQQRYNDPQANNFLTSTTGMSLGARF